MEKKNIYINTVDESIENFEKYTQADWDRFFYEYFNKNTRFLLSLFPIIKGESLYYYILPVLSDLSKVSISKINISVNSLLKKELNSQVYDKLEDIFEVIEFFDFEINVNQLVKLVENEGLLNNVRANAAALLNACHGNILYSFWSNIDLSQNNIFLLPYYISFYQFIDPVRGLKSLSLINKLPQNIAEFEIPVKKSLLTIQSSISAINELIVLFYKKSCWQKAYINEIIDSYPDLMYLQRIINEKQGKLISLKVGISVFPDLMLLDFFKLLGIFEEKGLDLEIKYYPWNKLFNYLEEGEVDLIIANKIVCDCENEKTKTEKFKYYRGFNQFDGFTIISKGKEKSFETLLKEECKGDVDSALKATLEQLQCKKIIASKNTDHYLTLSVLIKRVGLDLRQFNIIDKFEPHIGFLEFIKDENVNCFIGGAPHTHNAIKLGYTKLISEEDSNFGATQENGIISLYEKYEEMKNIVRRFSEVIDIGIDFYKNNKNNRSYSTILSMYNQKIIDEYIEKMNKKYKPFEEMLFMDRDSFTQSLNTIEPKTAYDLIVNPRNPENNRTIYSPKKTYAKGSHLAS